MPRLAWLDAPGTLHHVMGRGIEGNERFRVKKDRGDFLDRLATVCEEMGILGAARWRPFPTWSVHGGRSDSRSEARSGEWWADPESWRMVAGAFP